MQLILRRTNRMHIVTVKITSDLNTVILINGEHNHDAEETINKQTVTSLLKRESK
jgi:hypothetical protein